MSIEVPSDFEIRERDLASCNVSECGAVVGRPWLNGDARDLFDRRRGFRDRAVAITDPRVSAWTALMNGAAQCHVACTIAAAHGHSVTRVKPVALEAAGLRIEVKWGNEGWLLCHPQAACIGVADLYVLVRGRRPDRLSIVGACDPKRMLRERHHFGYATDPYAVPGRDLRPLAEWVDTRSQLEFAW